MINRRVKFLCYGLLYSMAFYAQSTGEQVIWFDRPNQSVATPVWGEGKVSPSEGNTHSNKDREWDRFSLPVGNGSIGANVFGSVATERLTFNEKTLWRGGPNTEKGADYYWNVNKNGLV